VAQSVLSRKANGDVITMQLAWGFAVAMAVWISGGVSGKHVWIPGG